MWQAPATLRGSLPSTHGGDEPALGGAAGASSFLSYHDGWPHLYSMPEAGGEPLLLTPGGYMVEHVTLSPDGAHLLFSANTGPARGRHRPASRGGASRWTAPTPEVLTPGTGLEWTPVVTGDGRTSPSSARPRSAPRFPR